MSCEMMAWSGDGAVPDDQISGAKGSPNTRSRKSPEAPPPSAVCASFYKIGKNCDKEKFKKFKKCDSLLLEGTFSNCKNGGFNLCKTLKF